MSNSQVFEVRFLKKMTIGRLIEKCRQYVEEYLSPSAALRFDKAYKASRFDEVKHILEKTLERIKNKIKISEYQKGEETVMNEIQDANELFAFSDIKKRGKNNKMSANNGVNAVIIIIVAIIAVAIVGTVSYFKVNGKRNNGLSNQTVDKVLARRLKKENRIKYTEKDKDLMCLIHELSVIYDNTDQYLNS